MRMPLIDGQEQRSPAGTQSPFTGIRGLVRMRQKRGAGHFVVPAQAALTRLTTTGTMMALALPALSLPVTAIK